MATITQYHAKSIRPLHDRVVISDMDFGDRMTNGGIIVPSDDTKSEGIRPRWGKVFAIGPEQTDVEVGEYVLVAHGRWTRGISIEINGQAEVLRMIDNNDILLVSKDPMNDETWSTAITGHSDRKVIDGSLHNDGTQSDY